MNRFFFKPFKKLSRGRRLNIKRVIFFPLIVYSAYLLLDSFMPLFMVGLVIWLLYNWTGKSRFWSGNHLRSIVQRRLPMRSDSE